MFEITGLIVFGFFVGAYGTMVGIGGGPLIVPFLIICYKFTPVEIVATSLCVVLFNVFAGTISYYKQKRIDVITGTKFGIAAIPGALIGTSIPHLFTLRFLEIIFGVLLMALAIYLYASLLSSRRSKMDSAEISATDECMAGGQPKPNGSTPYLGQQTHAQGLTRRVILDSDGKRYEYLFNEKLGVIISAVIGFIAPTLGIGGGVIHVPFLSKVLNFPIHIATATAHYQLLICVLFAIIPYIIMDVVHFNIAIPMAFGVIFGAGLGANLSKKLSGEVLFSLLAFVLVILALRLLLYQ